ncbi:hypothetical protein Hte_007910 [Hypoxylon texense]
MDTQAESKIWTGNLVQATDSYALLRDCNASSRLTAQYYLWKELLGFLVHPDIPTQAADLRVADVATGNGIWLHDLARDKPTSAEFHGFDSSLDQVGPRPWLPANIRMHTWNIFEEPPSQFMGYFDVVHVRLITVWSIELTFSTFQNLAATFNGTKSTPSGVRQKPSQACRRNTSKKSTRNSEGMIQPDRLMTPNPSWKYDLTKIMNENGYSDSSLYTYEYGLSTARIWNDVYVSTWKEFADNVLKNPKAVRELEQKGMDEARNGAALMFPKLVWVARKT